MTVNEVAALGPKATPLAPRKSVPVMATVVPPPVGPWAGAMEPMAGTLSKV